MVNAQPLALGVPTLGHRLPPVWVSADTARFVILFVAVLGSFVLVPILAVLNQPTLRTCYLQNACTLLNLAQSGYLCADPPGGGQDGLIATRPQPGRYLSDAALDARPRAQRRKASAPTRNRALWPESSKTDSWLGESAA